MAGPHGLGKLCNMELSIIVLSYNTKDLTINCLKSIVEQYKEELEKDRFEIIVVDNASTDDSLDTYKNSKSKISKSSKVKRIWVFPKVVI